MVLSKEEKQLVQDIKKLVQSRDFVQIEEGITLAQQSNNPNIFDELLGDVVYEQGFFSNGWKGTGADVYHFSTAILGLLNAAPTGSQGVTLRDSFTSLRLTGRNDSGWNFKSDRIYAKYLSNFSSLKTLDLMLFDEIIGFEEIYHLPIETLKISQVIKVDNISGDGKTTNGIFPKSTEKWGFKHIQQLEIGLPNSWNAETDFISHVNFVSDLVTLKSFSCKEESRNYGKNSQVFSLSGLETLVNLEQLDIKADVNTLTSLRSLTSLRVLKLESTILEGLDGIPNSPAFKALECTTPELKDISAISSALHLEYLSLAGSTKLDNLKCLNTLKNLEYLGLSKTSIKNLEGLEHAELLMALDVNETPLENFDALGELANLRLIIANECKELKSLKGLKKSVCLKELNLEKCAALASLDGLENSTELSLINLNKTGLKHLDPLKSCAKLVNNIKWEDEAYNAVVKKFDESYGLSISNINYRPDITREYYPQRAWNEPALREFSIVDCPNLESIEGLKSAGIQVLQVMNCTKLIDINYMSTFTALQCCDFTDCAELASVDSLANLPLLDRLILKKCYKAKPKPRFLVMDSVEKVNEYLFKFKKEKTKVEISKDKKGAKDKLQELLLSNDYNQINLGLDLAKSISDFEIFGHLLHGVQLINNQIIPNSTFLGNDKNKAFLTYALEGLLSVAPKDIEVAVLYRKSLKTKEIRGAHFTSLISISGLENLESLTIAETGITIFSDTSNLQNLEKLVLKKNAGLKDLSGLKELKKLKSIQIENCGIVDLKGFTDLMHLESIEISGCIGLKTTDGIMNMPALAKIRLEFCTNLENIDALGNLSKLNEISLSYCPSIQQLKPLTKLYALQVLKMDKHKLSNLDGISELIKPILEGLRG